MQTFPVISLQVAPFAMPAAGNPAESLPKGRRASPGNILKFLRKLSIVDDREAANEYLRLFGNHGGAPTFWLPIPWGIRVFRGRL
jgi:hypothetical protein